MGVETFPPNDNDRAIAETAVKSMLDASKGDIEVVAKMVKDVLAANSATIRGLYNILNKDLNTEDKVSRV